MKLPAILHDECTYTHYPLGYADTHARQTLVQPGFFAFTKFLEEISLNPWHIGQAPPHVPLRTTVFRVRLVMTTLSARSAFIKTDFLTISRPQPVNFHSQATDPNLPGCICLDRPQLSEPRLSCHLQPY